jgi:Phosphate-induced protein 1 conserved region
MSRLTSVALVPAGLLALAACADNTPVAAPAAPSVQESAVHLGIAPVRGAERAHPLFANNGNETNHGNAGPNNGALVQAGIQYHGGPVLQAGTKVAAIYWSATTIYAGGPTPGSTGAGSADGSNVGYFLNHIGGSPYFNINTSYTNSAGLPIVNSVTYTQFWANNSVSVPSGTKRVTDATMLSMLQSGFNTGKLTYDPNTLYAIFTQGAVNLGGGFGTQYCAYHSWGNVTVGGVTKTVLYAAMPDDYAKPSACSSGLASPNNDPHADAVVSTLVHETEETTTDPNGNAWWRTSTGAENADLCAWTWGTTYTTANGGVANVHLGTKDFLIQRNWLNVGSGSCQLSF